jgi:hypothetical protein
MGAKIFFSTLFLLMLNAAALFAQPGEPCAGTDPDATCPLDSWVLILAAVVVIFAFIHLSGKRSAQKTRLS